MKRFLAVVLGCLIVAGSVCAGLWSILELFEHGAIKHTATMFVTQRTQRPGHRIGVQ